MNVTVSLRCMAHEFYFLNSLMQWTFSPPCTGVRGVSLGSFASTMQSEDMMTTN
jgi:hypothetical protein